MAEKDNGLPESWRRAEAARRVLRKSSARATEASPLPDPARKLRSSLKHFKQEVPGPKDGKLIKTVFESRGIRRSTRRVYNDPVEKLGQALFSWTPTDTFETLYKKANRHLRACKYQDILEVIGLADAMAQNEGLEAASPEVVSRHLDLWVTQIEEQTGSLSIETAAARFLRAHDRVALHLEAPAYLLDKWSLRCSHRTLARLAVIGGGPAFRKTGRDTLYDIASLDVWAQQKLGPAAETAAEHREIAAVMHGHAA